MSRERDPRVGKAFNAMKMLGISAETVKPVLKRLLKLYDKNWELIEDGNYWTLADAIFESMDEETGQNGAVKHEEPEPPKKKHQKAVLEDEASSTMDNGFMIPQTSSDSKSMVSPESVLRPPKKEPGCHLPSVRPTNKRKEKISHLTPKKESLAIGGSSNALVAGHGLREHGSVLMIREDTRKNKEPLMIEYSERDLKKRASSGSGSSNSLVVVQQQPDKRRPLQKISDITNGTEKVSISLVDEMGGEQLPKFFYIPQNLVYQSAYVHVSLARIADEDCCPSCKEDCLLSSVPCACARDTGGEFAYTTEGLLKEEFLNTCISMNQEPQKHYHYYCDDCPLERAKNGSQPEKCKGHLVRKFIKECWRKCGCNMRCGNRVVQRGISRKLQVFSTNEGKGWGVRTLEELPKGAFVCEYIGEILTNMELYERNNRTSNERHTYPVLLDADWGSEGVLKDEDALCLDATYYGNVARFINHRCYDANLLEFPVEVENPDHHYYHLAFFTKRKLNALEELTWDYGIDFDDHNHPIKAFQCSCGSPFCRDKKGKRAKGKNIIA